MIKIKLYGGINVNKLQFLGAGTQGKVYRIDSKSCIKIFKSKKVCINEIETLAMAQIDYHFPRLYKFGENYIIRECIDGIELNKYLSKNPLTENISKKILELYTAMNKVGFKRLDAALFHIFIISTNEFKLIDTARAMKKTYVYPKLIIKGLEEHGFKREFLDFVKATNPNIYSKWLEYIQ